MAYGGNVTKDKYIYSQFFAVKVEAVSAAAGLC